MGFNLPHRFRLLAVLFGCWLLASASARAGDSKLGELANLREQLTKAAQDVKAFLTNKTFESVGVGQFTATNVSATSGPVISKMLTEELEKAKVPVKLVGGITLVGFYSVNKEKTGAKLRLEVRDPEGALKQEFVRSYEFAGLETMSHLFGGHGKFSPGAGTEVREKELAQSLTPQGNHPTGETRVKATPDSPFALEILVKKKGDAGEPRAGAVGLREKMPFVQIAEGEVYQIRLYNHSEHEAAVLLTVDGLSVFTFSKIKGEDGRPKFTRYVIPKGQKTASGTIVPGVVTLKGWHKDFKDVHQFLVTSYPESAAFKQGVPGNIGTITATFAAAWTDNKVDRPQDEAARNVTGTGLGPDIAQPTRPVSRIIGVPRAAITVRYAR